VEVEEGGKLNRPEGFVKTPPVGVIFPRTAYLNHLKIEERNPKIGDDFSEYRFNRLIRGNDSRKAWPAGG
jgi:indolepyruvate ferredoxin oxidoreductase alpha subunit